MTNWWWVRHGPTHEKSFVGWRDVPADLSDADQIARLNAFLPADALLVSSDLLRAVQTADALDEGRVRLPNSAAIREFNFGDWDGLRFDEVAERDPDLSRAYWERPGDITPPGGESWNAASARIAPFVQDINARYSGRHIIAVAHIGVIMTQIQMASGISAVETLSHKIDNLSVTRLSFSSHWDVDLINRVP